MKNILYIVSTLVKAGPTNQLYYLIKYLDRTEINPIVLTLSKEPQNSLIDRFRGLNVEIIQLNLSRLAGLFQARSRIKKVIQKKGIDLIHSHFIRSDLLNVTFSLPRVITMRNNPFFVYPERYGRVFGGLLAKSHFFLFQRASQAIACSKSLSELLQKERGFISQYITNGVDTTIYFPPTLEEKNLLRDRLSLPQNKKILISIVSALPGKDPETVIRAVLKSKHNLLLLLAGAIDQKIKEAYQDDQQIIFLGKVNAIQDYYRASDYFISASHSEGMPNAVLEAASSGLPLILSDIVAHREILSDLKHSSRYLFPIKDDHQLLDRIQLILKEDYQQLSKEVRAHIMTHFSSKTMSFNYQQLYLNILKQRG